jgi:hypothetical protein
MKDKNENGYYIKVWRTVPLDTSTPVFNTTVDAEYLLSALRCLQPENKYELCSISDIQAETSHTQTDAEEDASQVIYPDVWDMSPLDS